MEVLKNAEVVVYDSLVGQGVLSKIPKGVRFKIDGVVRFERVGKDRKRACVYPVEQ